MLCGSGKSIDLLKVAYNYEQRGHKVLLLTPSLDNRYGSSKITTRIGLSKDVLGVNFDDNIFDIFKNKYNDVACVLVDEVQFLTTIQIDELSSIVDFFNIPVICYGLRTDFKTFSFEGSKRLLEIADTIEEIKTICQCGNKAIYNARFLNGNITNEGKQVMLGDLEYKSLCRKCYNNLVKENIDKSKTNKDKIYIEGIHYI